MRKIITMFLLIMAILFVPQSVSAKAKLNKTKLYLVKGAGEKITVTGTSKTITWSSGDKSIATVDKKGTVAGKKAGETTIKAKFNGTTLSCRVYVMSLNQSKIEVTPKEAATLKVVNAQGTVKWQSNSTKVATVASDGTIKGISSGTTTVKATCAGRSFTCHVYVPALNLNKTEYIPGESGTASISNAMSKAEWKSNNTSVATIAKDGKVKALKPGTVKITYIGRNDSGKVITELSKNINVYDISDKNITLLQGKTRYISILNGKNVSWSSSDNNKATVDSNGKITAKAPGICKITGKVGNASLTCNVTIAGVTINKTNMKIAETDKAKAENTGKVIYKSSDENILTINTNGELKGKNTGSATITAQVYDQKGSLLGEVKKTVNVCAMEKESLVLTQGESESNAMLGGKNVSWRSDNTSVATVSSSGLITAKKTGVCNVYASTDGLSFKVPVYVLSLATNKITMTVADNSKTVSLLNARDSVTYSSSDISIAKTNNNKIIPVRVGECKITATSSGKSFTCNVIIKNTAKTQAFFDALSDMGKALTKQGFSYDKNAGDGSFEAAASGKKEFNCALYVSWTLQKTGAIPKGKTFWLNEKMHGSAITYMQDNKNKFQIIHPSSSQKTSMMAYREELVPGDICGFTINGYAPHTAVYAGKDAGGKPLWYSGGSGDFKKLKSNGYKPLRFSYYEQNNDYLYTIIRLK